MLQRNNTSKYYKTNTTVAQKKEKEKKFRATYRFYNHSSEKCENIKSRFGEL